MIYTVESFAKEIKLRMLDNLCDWIFDVAMYSDRQDKYEDMVSAIGNIQGLAETAQIINELVEEYQESTVDFMKKEFGSINGTIMTNNEESTDE